MKERVDRELDAMSLAMTALRTAEQQLDGTTASASRSKIRDAIRQLEADLHRMANGERGQSLLSIRPQWKFLFVVLSISVGAWIPALFIE
jgi:hypothetical protein